MATARPAAAAAASPRGEALPTECDLLVLGSGAGGLATAITAAHLGLKVVVLEKTAFVGGTTAWSGGWMWIPRNPLALAAGIDDPLDEVRAYLQHLMGAQYGPRAARLEAFLAHGPAMVDFFRQHSLLRFVDGNAIPDFHGQAPGARSGGRSVCAAPFDAAVLGPVLLQQLRPPLDVHSFMGLSIGGDLKQFMRANRSSEAFWYVAGRLWRQAVEKLRHGQGTWRWGGNALVAALYGSAIRKGVTVLTRHQALSLLARTDGIAGALVRTAKGRQLQVKARRGVVLATGGFPHDVARRKALFAHAPTGAEHWSAAPPDNTGDGLRLAEAMEAALDTALADAGAWAPVSLVPRPAEGRAAVRAFPHLAERGKPGLIAVDARGQRFADEAGNYHSLMRGLFAARTPAGQRRPEQPVQAWLVVDHRFQRRYGLGHAKPWPFPVGGLIANGYLKRGRTLAELAQACGIDAKGLQATVEAVNQAAREGHDPQFHRGATPYDRMQGDAEHGGPNPCVAPIVQPPFYAVRIVPGSLGTFAGIAVNPHGQALNARGEPIAGLYAAGNDMASVMGGHYPSGGITLGPAMTFGWITAHHAAGQALAMPLDESEPEHEPEPAPEAEPAATAAGTAEAERPATEPARRTSRYTPLHERPAPQRPT